MVELRENLDLLEEALASYGDGDGGLEDLERDIALVFAVSCEVHGRHAALPKDAAEFVPVGQRGRESGRDFGIHGGEIWRSAGSAAHLRNVGAPECHRSPKGVQFMIGRFW